MSMEYKDFLVETGNPAALDATLNQIGAALVGGPNYLTQEGYYVARTFNPDFFLFACQNQGYCKVIREVRP